MANVSITRETLAWVEALADNGMFLVGADGKGDITPDAKKILEALHEQLAGGDVEVTVKSAGTAATRDDLNAKLEDAMKAANVSAGAAGPFVFSP
jgi:hypothetical protein